MQYTPPTCNCKAGTRHGANLCCNDAQERNGRARRCIMWCPQRFTPDLAPAQFFAEPMAPRRVELSTPTFTNTGRACRDGVEDALHGERGGRVRVVHALHAQADGDAQGRGERKDDAHHHVRPLGDAGLRFAHAVSAGPVPGFRRAARAAAWRPARCVTRSPPADHEAGAASVLGLSTSTLSAA